MELFPVRHGLFEVPIWELDLGESLIPVREQLIIDGRTALIRHPAENRPFRQTVANLHELYDSYAELASMCVDIIDAVLGSAVREIRGVPAPEIHSVKCWVLEVVDSAAWDAQAQRLSIFHNHPGSVFSSVLYLDGDGTEGDTGGTVFRSPLAHVADPRLIPATNSVPWKSSRFVMFPSWLEHGPLRPGPRTRSRLSVAMDYLS